MRGRARPGVSKNRRFRLPVLLPLLLLATGCDRAHSAESSATGRDSPEAEIEAIGRTSAPLQNGFGTQPIGVDSEPILRLGSDLESEAHSFSGDMDATRLSDGRIVVADGGARELKVFDETGRFLQRFGGSGQGPGEFSFLSELAVGPGDTLIAGDWRQSSRFSPDGSFVDRTDADLGGLRDHLPMGQVRGGVEFLGNGTVLLISTAGMMDGDEGSRLLALQEDGGIVRYPVTYHLTTLDLGFWADCGAGLGPESVSPEGVRDGNVPALVPFLAQTLHAPFPGGESLVLGDSRSGEIRVLDRGGGLLGTFNHSWDPVRITHADRRAWVETFLPNRVGFEQLERNWVGIDLPGEMPAFSSIRVDTEGFIWVLDYDWLRSGAKNVSVYTPSGVQVGAFLIEGVSRLLEVGKDHLLGLGFDDLEVPLVLVFEVERES